MGLPVLTSTSGVNHPKSPGLSGEIPDSVQRFARLGGDPGEGSMHREFSILRMKADAATWEYPLSWDEVTKFSPLGAFSEFELHRLRCAIATFPRAKPVRDGRRAWTIRGVEAWLTSDGSLFIDGLMDLEFMHSLFLHLRAALPNLLLEDRITGVVHDERSLHRLMMRDLPFEPDRAA
jgi:hypothetical protein